MTLSDLSIKSEYRTFTDNIVDVFYLPLLSKAVLYRRAVGYFSSSILLQISLGIERLSINEGVIQIVASPNLSEDDVAAIKRGYQRRDEIVRGAVLRELHNPQNEFEARQLNLLANLIAENVLDIKIALTENEKRMGMYHEKMGIISDRFGNAVAFSGSMNETQAAISLNYETIDVFCSWKSPDEAERVKNKECAFTSIWNDIEPNVKIISFPELKDELIKRYKVDHYELFSVGFGGELMHEPRQDGPSMPADVILHDYQIEAINKWETNEFRGIFDMATGTGKTFTGLGAIVRLSARLKGRLAVFIVAPFQHLVDQWVEDIRRFGMEPIIGHSASLQRNWLKRLDNAIRDQKLNIKGGEFFCFVCTNATFSSAKVRRLIDAVHADALFVADEAHYFGAKQLQTLLTETFNYRLALSATLNRHYDEEGTNRLFNYFGKKCIEYTLGRAIEEKMLTPYRYYPVIVTLDDDERKEYEYLTFEMGKCLVLKDGQMALSERGKRLAIKRARGVAAAKSKIFALETAIQPYIKDKHILVYCGACKLLLEGDQQEPVDDDERRQISVVSSLLGNKLGITCSHFTSREDAAERAELKQRFAQGDLQALVAIKCLDEGVNIPAIKTAFILASTTNPKEYIQRRGRILRLYPGKEYAELYDFITLPYPLNEVGSLTVEQLGSLLTLVKNEVKRAEDFASLALNAGSAITVIGKIKDAYRLYEDLSDYEELKND